MQGNSNTSRNIAYTRKLLQTAGIAREIWPVWSNSTTREVRFTPLPKKERWRLWRAALLYDRQHRGASRTADKLGRIALRVYNCLLFEFLNKATGELFPTWETIARACNYSVRSVATALAKLRDARLIDWLRRAEHDQDELGRFRLRQQSNAYGVMPLEAWRDFRNPAPPSLPPGLLALELGRLYFGTDNGPLEVGGELKRARDLLARMHGYNESPP